MSKFKIGDKVKVTQSQLLCLNEKIGTVKAINGHMFGVKFEEYYRGLHALGGLCKDGYGWWFEEYAIELVRPVAPTVEPVALTLAEIKNNHLNCLIHTRTQEEANALCRMLGYRSDQYREPDWWKFHKEKTVYRIASGKIASYSDINFYQTDSHYAKMPMYEFADITEGVVIPKIDEVVIPKIDIDLIVDKDKCANGFIEKITETMSTMGCRTFMVNNDEIKNIKNKENDNMNKDAINFTFTKGERTAIVVDTIEHKDKKNNTILEKKTREVKIPTIKTTAYNINGVASTTCDEEDFHERVGCLVASAKIIASKSEEANLMYQIAMKSWGTDMSTIILETLADRAYAGNFEKYYDKWIREEKKLNDDKCKCKICGKKFDTPDDAREHEEWHVERKRTKRENYLIRKEAKHRLAEKEKENKIEKAIIEIKKEEEKNRNK